MRAICPGSYDPITNGHLDVIGRAAQVFDQVLVAVGVNTSKNALFDGETRLRLVREATKQFGNVAAIPLSGLLVDACAQHEVGVIVKGLRFGSDFDYELQQAHINGEIGAIETVFLPASREWGTISSTMVREVALVGGPIAAFVPKCVVEEVNLVRQAKTG